MKWLFWLFAAAYLVAVALFAVSAFGLFGQPRDPLGAIFLLPLGLPWTLVAARLETPPALLVVALPLINLAILYWLWKGRRRTA
ncbi:hypothetical protein ABDK56_09180 [Sphingomonas sp. ASV193]|uniref:hypothetical protein n=1 Tax=Sphingomonas sp. ASV193 TaxID=3144405 RepID=UPI0032E86955